MKDVFTYLSALAENNNREWFGDNKPEFQRVNEIVKAKFNTVFENVKKDDDVDFIKVYRIYRDVRFSKNKTPYKTNFSGAIHRVKPQLRGGYFMQLEPNNKSFIACGFWNPDKNDLLRIRKEFEMDDEEIRDILNEKSFKTTWGAMQGEALKTAPKGFDKTHKAIDLLRFKQFLFVKPLTDKEVFSKDFETNTAKDFKAIRPFFDYMTDVLTTDLNGESLL